MMALLIVCGMLAGCGSTEKESIVVGSKDFQEQEILGSMMELLIEAHTDLAVIRRGNMASHVIFAAITNDAVDVYMDYTGTVYGYYLDHSFDEKSAEEIYELSASELMEKYDLRMLGMPGFNNTFCLAVRSETAAEYGLKTFSDLANVSSDFIFGGSTEIANRNDGLPNLKRLYDMSFKEEREIHNESRYLAIANDEIQVAEAFATDGLLMEHDLVVLEDDKYFFPPYHGTIIIREEIIKKHPELSDVLGVLIGAISDDTMRNLNYRVAVYEESPRDVAESFLRENNFI